MIYIYIYIVLYCWTCFVAPQLGFSGRAGRTEAALGRRAARPSGPRSSDNTGSNDYHNSNDNHDDTDNDKNSIDGDTSNSRNSRNHPKAVV